MHPKEEKAVHTAIRRRLSEREPPVKSTAHLITITAHIIGQSEEYDAEIPGSKRDVGQYFHQNRDLGFVTVEKGERNVIGRRIWIFHPTETYEGGDR
jgi:hypothetical protein